MKILFVGDIVGKPGRKAFAAIAGEMKRDGRVDFVVANAENAAGGRGPSSKIARQIFDAGADVITLGDHAWDEKELLPMITEDRRIVRPANFAPGCPGRGWTTISTPRGNLTVLNLIGRVFMQPLYDCPFQKSSQILADRLGKSSVILVDFHAEATSEKIAMGRHLDGRVTAVVGTHTHVQTADECILPEGSAYITDVGMTGPKDSVIGREVQPVLQKFRSGMPQRFDVAARDVWLEGVLIEADPDSGRALSIERIKAPLEE
jgi:2',3'-cyclic-nucleotide 2'-phosphodiesterase